MTATLEIEKCDEAMTATLGEKGDELTGEGDEVTAKGDERGR